MLVLQSNRWAICLCHVEKIFGVPYCRCYFSLSLPNYEGTRRVQHRELFSLPPLPFPMYRLETSPKSTQLPQKTIMTYIKNDKSESTWNGEKILRDVHAKQFLNSFFVVFTLHEVWSLFYNWFKIYQRPKKFEWSHWEKLPNFWMLTSSAKFTKWLKELHVKILQIKGFITSNLVFSIEALA